MKNKGNNLELFLIKNQIDFAFGIYKLSFKLFYEQNEKNYFYIDFAFSFRELR